MRLSSVFLAIHVLLVSFASARAEDFSLTILHINDVHSRIQAINKYNSTCKPKGISAFGKLPINGKSSEIAIAFPRCRIVCDESRVEFAKRQPWPASSFVTA